MDKAVQDFLDSIDALRQGRVRFAEQFAIAKSRGSTDGQATQYAIAVTGDELTTLEANVAVARLSLPSHDGAIEHGL